MDFQPDAFGHRHDAFPAGLRIESVGLTLHEGDAPMAQIVQMLESQQGSAIMVHHDVGGAFDLLVPGETDVVAALFCCRRRAIAVDDGHIEKAALARLPVFSL